MYILHLALKNCSRGRHIENCEAQSYWQCRRCSAACRRWLSSDVGQLLCRRPADHFHQHPHQRAPTTLNKPPITTFSYTLLRRRGDRYCDGRVSLSVCLSVCLSPLRINISLSPTPAGRLISGICDLCVCLSVCLCMCVCMCVSALYTKDDSSYQHQTR